MVIIFFIATIIVILTVAGFTYITLEKIWNKIVNIKQGKCPNFHKTPKFYYIMWASRLDKKFPRYNRIIVDEDVSKVRKRIKKLRKKYKDTLKYVVYEQRDLTNFIDWE